MDCPDDSENVLRRIEALEPGWSIPAANGWYHGVPTYGGPVRLWSVPRATGELLEAWAKRFRCRVVLELGCSAGYSTLFLARGVKPHGGVVYTTELLEEKIALARANFDDARLSGSIHLVEGDIEATLRGWGIAGRPQVDLVFMDADKARYVLYLELLLPLLRPSALIIADNIRTHSSLVEPFVAAVRAHPCLRSHVLDLDNGLLVARKRLSGEKVH